MPSFTRPRLRANSLYVAFPTALLCFEPGRAEPRTVARTPGVPLAEALASAMRDAPRGVAAIVASSEFFAQRVALPAVQTNGLSPDDLASALLYEAEPFSNIPRERGAFAFAPAAAPDPTLRAWNVLHVAKDDVNAIAAALRAARARLAGVANPFALDAFSAMAMDEGDPATVARFQRLFASLPSCSDEMPVVHGVVGQRSPIATFAVAATLAVALVCGTHYAITSAALRRAERETAARESVKAQLAQLNRQAESFRARTKAILDERAARAEGVAALASERTLWAALLKTLSEVCAESSLLVQSIDATGPHTLRLKAIPAPNGSPAAALAKLARALQPLGWTATPHLLSTAPARLEIDIARQNLPGDSSTKGGG